MPAIVRHLRPTGARSDLDAIQAFAVLELDFLAVDVNFGHDDRRMAVTAALSVF
jgi:hypothetical protein